MREPRTNVPKLDGILAGSDEPVFRLLPQSVMDDLKHTGSESALVWNSIYPRAQPALQLSELIRLRPLWGSTIDPINDNLIPFYWGFDQSGVRLPELDRALETVDGPGPKTEVDLFLLGESELVLVEAKQLAGLGTCGRYGSQRCPEIHLETADPGCRYWLANESLFSTLLDFGDKPEPHVPPPPCNRHYQLGRTALVGTALAGMLKRRLHLWLILPRDRWGAVRRDWIDFADRIHDEQLWKHLRVIAWEDILSLGQQNNLT